MMQSAVKLLFPSHASFTGGFNGSHDRVRIFVPVPQLSEHPDHELHSVHDDIGVVGQSSILQ